VYDACVGDGPTRKGRLAGSLWPLSKAKALLHSAALVGLAMLTSACGQAPLAVNTGAPLFVIPVSVNNMPVGSAIIDTGGGYDLMLADRHGLEIVDTVEILVFHGIATAGITEPFDYAAGGFAATADTALVGVDLCDCNGLGFFFLRKSGAVLGLDFDTGRATLNASPPQEGVYIPFAMPPPEMADFDTSFLEVEISDGDDQTVSVIALLDTGSNVTLLRRGLMDAPRTFNPDLVDVLITRGELGTVSARVTLFDTPGLPDLLIGTDVMRAWSNRWHFVYRETGGLINALPRALPPDDADAGVLPAAKRLPYRVAP